MKQRTRLLRIYRLAEKGFDVGFQDVIARLDHAAMTVAVEFVEIGLPMAYELHHTGQILVLVVTTEEFQLAVATDEDERWTVRAYPVERRIFVNGRLQGTDALHLTDVIVGDGLATEGGIEPDAVGVDIISLQPSLVQAEHQREVAKLFLTCLQATTMEPDNDGAATGTLRVIDIELQPFLRIGIGLSRKGYIAHGQILLLRTHGNGQQACANQGYEFFHCFRDFMVQR